MNQGKNKVSWAKSLVFDKCPNCGKGDVFDQQKKWYELPVMHEKCNLCNYHFDREPGYFLGAMYLSYGFAAIEGILAFFLCSTFLPNLNVTLQIAIVLGVIFLCGRKNYKMSRILYMHIFPW